MAKRKQTIALAEAVEPLIREIRGERVILDSDLARIYRVPTKRLNEQVHRNAERFPPDFIFRLTAGELDSMRSQNATASRTAPDIRSQNATASKRNVRFLPYAFTEHGAIMAANVLNSPQAVQTSVFVVRAFMKMRGVLSDTRLLAKKLANIEAELKSRLDVHEVAIVEILQRLMAILDPPPTPPQSEPKRKEIGFHTKPDARAKGLKHEG